MKVSELITKLQTLDGDLPVFVDGYEGGIQLLQSTDIAAVEAIYRGTRSYMGDYDHIDRELYPTDQDVAEIWGVDVSEIIPKITKGVLISR